MMQLISYKETAGAGSVSSLKIARRALATVFVLALCVQQLSAAINVTARFNPPRIAMGDRSQYIVEITETDTGRKPEVDRITALPIPQTSAIKLSNGRISSNQHTRIINGAAEYSITQSLIIEASPTGIGSVTIPAYIFEYKGKRVQVPAATLQVIERSADAGPTQDELVFLKTDLPETLYVGQTIALNLKLYIEEDVQLRGLNSFDRTADGFTISELPDDSKEGVEMFSGRRYRTLTWPLIITPIQTGEQQISFHFGLTARLPNQGNNRDRLGRSPFGGSLFDDLLGRSERLNIYTDSITINVRPLPLKGQPDSFSGAIGDIAMEVGTDAEEAIQGEPIMLSIALKGRGNFERINAPELQESFDWRHYDPETQFEAKDTLGLTGNQRFDYVFIPKRAGDLKLPEIRFSYFDPEKEEYVELTAPAIPVKVSPAKNNFAPAPTLPQPRIPESDLRLSKTLTPEEALLTLDYRQQPARPIGYGILSSPKFISFNVLAGLLLIGSSIALALRKRNRKDPFYPIRVEAQKALKQDRQACLKAAQENNADAFFKNGQSAIRHAATLRAGRSMQSADSAEIEALLPGPAAEVCRSFFAAANAQRFGGSTAKDISDAQQQIESILKAL